MYFENDHKVNYANTTEVVLEKSYPGNRYILLTRREWVLFS